MPGRHGESFCGANKDTICRGTRKKTFDDKTPASDPAPLPSMSLLVGRERQRALLAILLREIDPCQGCRPITPPSAAARDRLGFLRWGVPEVPIHPGCLLPGLLGHPFDGEGARRTRVDHQRAQALDLAPDACLNRLNDMPLQGPYLTIAGHPVDSVPRAHGQA